MGKAETTTARRGLCLPWGGSPRLAEDRRATLARRPDLSLEDVRRRIFVISLALAAAAFLGTWALAGRDAFDNVASPATAGTFLVCLTSLRFFPHAADRIKIVVALLAVGYVAAKVTVLLFTPYDLAQFALRAAIFAPWGPVIVTMGWVGFGMGWRLYAVIAAYYAALLVPGGWWFVTHVSAAQGPMLAVGGSLVLASAVITVMLTLLVNVETHRAAAEAQTRILGEIAWVDLVTGLPNRRALEEALERETSRSGRTGGSLALIVFDLDGFKPINDRHGHHAGDEVLAAIGPHIRPVLRGADVLGRWGGDEFLVILPDTECDAAVGLAERIRTALAIAAFRTPGVPVTASLGVTTFQAREPIADAIARADTALYLAKSHGPNRVEVAA